MRDGWPIKSRKIAKGLTVPLSDFDIANIQDQCNVLQGEMLSVAAGGPPWAQGEFTGALRSLIDNYLNDKDSGYQKIRPGTRAIYANKLRRNG